MGLAQRTRIFAHQTYIITSLVTFLLRSNSLSSGLVDARIRSVLLSNVLSLWWGMITSTGIGIGMGGLITLPLSLLVFVGRLNSAVGRRSMSSVDGAWIVRFTVLIYAFFFFILM
jgi:hypothetical protein